MCREYRGIKANCQKYMLGKCQKYMKRPPFYIFPASWYSMNRFLRAILNTPQKGNKNIYWVKKIKKSIKLINLLDKKKNVTSYQLSNIQVNAILELRLQKLTAFGIGEIETEISELSKL